MVQALSYVDNYLASSDVDQNISSAVPNPPQRHGNVIAIVGEYGTGKTHLSIELLRRIKQNTAEDVHAFYLDAPADTFLALYRERFFAQLDRKDVRKRIAEYYADIVAEELGDSPLTEELARQLSERQVRAHDIVAEFGLSQSAFQQQLQVRLGQITEHEDFGTALGLFMRPEFEAAVWEWLAGHPADAVLRERGVLRNIDNDIAALEAIGVFAFLYGRQDHRFVLIIDEFEKVLSRDSRSVRSQASVLAFKKLLEVFAQARSLLVLSGLPDFIEVLPEDARQRISCQVRPTALSFTDAKQYIRQSLGRENGDLAPFNDDSIAYLVELAGGNARKVIRLCYHSYAASALAGADLTRAMVREVAREQFEISSPDDIRAEVTRLLDNNGWAFDSAKQLSADVIVDYWLPVGKTGNGCAIIITQSVLHEHEAEVLKSSALAISSSSSEVAAFLIVNGYLAEPLTGVVSSAFARVMTYAPTRFSDDFPAAVNAFIKRLEEASNQDRLSLVESKLEQLLRQTSGVRKSLDTIQRTSVSTALVEGAVDGGLRRAFSSLAGAPPSPTLHGIDPLTAATLERAIQQAETNASRSERRLRSLFVHGRVESSIADFREILNMNSLAQAILVAVRSLRDAIAELLMSRSHGESPETLYTSLTEACRAYDRFMHEIIDNGRFGSELSEVSDLSIFRRLGEEVWETFRGMR
ncbi:hypothetical protein [Streptomyces europaeiscabiei]|uniref:hypothetical protein n=1 Tax=Streptomyces europaeiscabiei TaxID=146819 RepID=UPI002E102E0F|nr:ATP-binding protein [Streptomyces europaeiscabiei]